MVWRGAFANFISRSGSRVELSHPNMVESWFGVELSQILFPGAVPAWSFRKIYVLERFPRGAFVYLIPVWSFRRGDFVHFICAESFPREDFIYFITASSFPCGAFVYFIIASNFPHIDFSKRFRAIPNDSARFRAFPMIPNDSDPFRITLNACDGFRN